MRGDVNRWDNEVMEDDERADDKGHHSLSRWKGMRGNVNRWDNEVMEDDERADEM